MPYAVNGDRQIIYRTPGATRSVLVALPVDIKASEELVALSNRGRDAGAVHTERPPGSVTVINEAAVNRLVAAHDLYREKIRYLIGDWEMEMAGDEYDPEPLPADPTDANLLEWLTDMVETLKSSDSYNAGYIAKLERTILDLRSSVNRWTTTEASLRAHYENAISDLNTANRELDDLRAFIRPVQPISGTVLAVNGTSVFVRVNSLRDRLFAIGESVTLMSVNGTQTPDEKVGDPQYINAG